MMRHVLLLLIGSIVLCSCAGKALVQPVVVQQTLECPAPERPQLPAVSGTLPLDHPDNVEALMERDDIMRQYMHALEDCVDCYHRQTHTGGR